MDDAKVQAATDLFLANEKLVWWTIRRFFGENPPERQEEMYGEGRYWLWRAALTYDPAKGGHVCHIRESRHSAGDPPVASSVSRRIAGRTAVCLIADRASH